MAFTVKSGSLLDLSKKEKHKGSFGHISQAAHNIGEYGKLLSHDLLKLVYTSTAFWKTEGKVVNANACLITSNQGEVS